MQTQHLSRDVRTGGREKKCDGVVATPLLGRHGSDSIGVPCAKGALGVASMAKITIFSPDGRQERELVEGHNSLGRHPNNTHQILDRIVSKEHCHIDRAGARWLLKDLGSLNGTFVNGERVSERALGPGDEISIGSTRIVFQDDVRPAPKPPAVPGATMMGAAPAARPAPPPPPRPAAPAGHAGPDRLSMDVAAVVGSAGIGGGKAAALGRVTMTPGMVESHIRTKIQPIPEENFLPEKMVPNHDALRADYEKLRVSYEVIRSIGVELDVDNLLDKILECAFQLLEADRGVVLLYADDPETGESELKPRCIRTKKQSDEEVVLSTSIINEVLRDRAGVLSSDASVDSRFKGAHSVIMQGIRSTMAVPLLHSDELLGVMVLDSQIATSAFTEKDLQLFQNIANQAAIAIQNSLYALKLEKEAVTRERFQRLLSPAIADQVISGKVEVKKGGEVRETTVLFSDIRGFTAWSESRAPQQIVDMLNEYFELMVEIVFQHEGTLDKFVGDEIMALFGAPVSHGDDAYRAVKTALEMLESLAVFNEQRVAAGQLPVQIGIGINTGEVVAGYLGSSKALDYTVIGDTVNTGARLCSVAKAGQIIVSEYTYRQVAEHFVAEELPPTPVKGKSQPLKIFSILGMR